MVLYRIQWPVHFISLFLPILSQTIIFMSKDIFSNALKSEEFRYLPVVLLSILKTKNNSKVLSMELYIITNYLPIFFRSDVVFLPGDRMQRSNR